MFVSTYAGAVAGIDAVKVTVEVNLTGGGLGLYLVGLPDNAVKESEQRIRAAFENTGRKMSGRKVVVNLAPADLRKEGAGFDLPIAVGILAAMSEVSGELLPTTMFAGELSLDGTLRPVRGVLPLAVKARDEGLRRLVVPAENAAEAAVVEGVEVYGLHSLGEVIALLNGERRFDATVPVDAEATLASQSAYAEDFADVKGQTAVKRALEIPVRVRRCWRGACRRFCLRSASRRRWKRPRYTPWRENWAQRGDCSRSVRSARRIT